MRLRYVKMILQILVTPDNEGMCDTACDGWRRQGEINGRCIIFDNELVDDCGVLFYRCKECIKKEVK